MWFDRKTDTYIPEFEERIKVVTFEPTITPWLNEITVDGNISVEFSAIDIPYDNSTSWLSATNVQAAIDELEWLIP